MIKGSASLRLISGVGKKGPACFLIEAEGKRLLLDLGEGPPPGCLPQVEGLGRVDAVVLSYGTETMSAAFRFCRKSAIRRFMQPGSWHGDCRTASPRGRCRQAARRT